MQRASQPGAEDAGADDREVENWHGLILSGFACHLPAMDCIFANMRTLLAVFALTTAWAQQNLFEPAESCKLCHSKLGDPVIGQFPLWSGSMMAHSAKDPYWRAKVKYEGDLTPAARASIEDKCLRCHAPMQQYPLRAKGQLLSMAALDDTGREGVSCTVCHKIGAAGLGKPASFTGGFQINTENEIYGPHAKPFPMPMMHHTGQFPTEGKHILDAALCGTCHTVITPTLDARGNTVGSFVEQAPYLEWLASDFAKSKVTCQSCHVPTLKDPSGAEKEHYIAHTPHGDGSTFPPTSPRKPFGQHTFLGGNTQMLRVMGVPGAERAEAFLRGSTGLKAEGRIAGSTLELTVEILNRTGHKLPTGFPSRRIWLHVLVRNAAGATVFESGAWDRRTGELSAAPPRQPHRNRITSATEVAVYEAEMRTPDGAPTMSLLRAAGYGKDNRILPLGFAGNAAIAPVGVDGDRDFVAGSDRVHYAVPVGTSHAPFTVTVEALFQSVAPRHLEGLDAGFAAAFAPHQAPVVLQHTASVIR
jgi:hypothetical protein